MTAQLFDPVDDDVARLVEFHAVCFAEAWTAQAIQDLLVTPNCFAFSTLDGFILARVAAQEAEILTLAVRPGARRRGLGRDLVAAAAGHARALGASELFLEVGTGNLAALALYEGLGLRPVARRKAYYGDQDALVLKAALPLSPPGKFA